MPFWIPNTRSAEEARRARNSLRQKLWADDQFAHKWLCHMDGKSCPDGSDCHADPERVDFYQSEIEE